MAEPVQGAWPWAGVEAAFGYEVVGLQSVGLERVASAPQEDAERSIQLLAPALGDACVVGIETLGPVANGELIVAGLAVDVDDLEAVQQQLFDHVLQ